VPIGLNCGRALRRRGQAQRPGGQQRDHDGEQAAALRPSLPAFLT